MKFNNMILLEVPHAPPFTTTRQCTDVFHKIAARLLLTSYEYNLDCRTALCLSFLQ